MKKFFINKNEEASQIIGRVLSDADNDIIIVVPRDSILKESNENFYILRHEAEAGKKNIIIESVDEEVLELAKKNHIDARHPLFHGDHTYSLSDIISGRQAKERIPEAKTEKESKHTAKKKDIKEEPLEEKSETPKKEVVSYHIPSYSFEGEKGSGKSSKSGRRFVVYLVVVVVFLGVALWFFGRQFGRATITLNFVKTPWSYSGAFMADKTDTQLDMTNRTIPAELFSQDKNMNQLFPVSGSEATSTKATGRITVYNAYSTASQSLVKTTRFVTPDGKVFRLLDSIVIPGATMSDGKLVPSSTDADIIADQPGAAYSIGPVDHLSIPGFQGTPKYQGFYGAIKGSTSIKVLPSEGDITAAEKKVSDTLQSSLQLAILSGESDDFKILNGASDFQVTKLTVNKNTDAQGNFSVFGTATFRALAFKESDLESLLGLLAKNGSSNQVLENLKIDFSGVKPDFIKGTLSFNANISGNLTGKVHDDDLKLSLAGHSLADVRQVILGVPGISDAKISLWPFWLQALPGDPSRISIDQK